MKAIEISCLCGAVKMQIKGEPVEQFYCHCDDCQAATSGPYVAVAIFPALLLPPGTFKPEFHIQCQYAVLPLKDDLPHFKAFPAKFGGSDETVDW